MFEYHKATLYARTLQATPKSRFLFIEPHLVKHQMSWLIHVKIGNTILYKTAAYSRIEGVLTIFDGAERFHILTNIILNNDTESPFLNLSSKYFQSLVLVEVDAVDDDDPGNDWNILFAMAFIQRPLTILKVGTNSKTKIRNNNLAHQILVQIITDAHEHTKVSIKKHRFDGLNEGGCSKGGFIIKQILEVWKFINASEYTSAYTTDHLGPYCIDGTGNEPLISDKGLKHLVYGQAQTLFIFYAYGPMYHIDIELHVQPAACSGLINPLAMCSFRSQDGADTVRKTPNNIISCSRNTASHLFAYSIKVFSGKGCLGIYILPSRNGISYFLSVDRYFRMAMSFVSPYQYAHFTDYKSIHTMATRITFKDMHSENLNVTESITTKISNISVAHFAYYSRINIHSPTYEINFQKVSASDKCAVSEENHFKPTPHKNIFFLEIRFTCGRLEHSLKRTYFYFFGSQRATSKMDYWSVIFLSIHRHVCQEDHHNNDILTIGWHKAISLSFNFTLTDLTVQAFDSTLMVFYEKVDSKSCSNVVIQFKTAKIEHAFSTSPFTTNYMTVSVAEQKFLLMGDILITVFVCSSYQNFSLTF